MRTNGLKYADFTQSKKLVLLALTYVQKRLDYRRKDFGLTYVGHAEQWDKAEIDGQLDARNCTITYRNGGRKLAVAVIHRDLEGLRAEVEFERTIATRE